MGKKRANGEGSLRKLKSGNWRAQISINGRRLSKTDKKQSVLLDWIKEMKGQMDRGLTYTGTQTRLSDWLDTWINAKKTGIAKNTTVLYLRHIDKIKPYLGNLKLPDLTPSRIQSVYRQMQESGAGARTIQLSHDVLRGALKLAHQQGLIAYNPTDSVLVPSVEEKEMQIWSESQVSQFLVSVKGRRNEFLYHLALATGMRRGELLGLRWKDVDFAYNTLRLKWQVIEPDGGGWELAPLKTKYSKRPIKLGENTLQKLREQMDIVALSRKVARDRWQENDLVFPSSVGTPITGDTIGKDFERLVRASGLPKIRFHDMRHTAASLMLLRGIPILIVSRILGHSKPSITLDLYGHLVSDSQDEAALLMDEITTPIPVVLDI